MREINFEDSTTAKYPILTDLEVLNLDFDEFKHFLKAEIYKSTKFKAPKIAKKAALVLLHSQKSISRKILTFPHPTFRQWRSPDCRQNRQIW